MMTGREAARQQALLDAMRGTTGGGLEAAGMRQRGERAARGLAAYRLNAAATAERALFAVFGGVRRMVGAADFGKLAREFWRDRPSRRGDLAEWGADLPGWLGTHPEFGVWPYLADCARVEWAVHCNERAADAVFDAGSLTRLGADDPAELCLVLMPGTAVVRSVWPIVTIHRAHASTPVDTAALDGARHAIEARRGENALVVRHGWQARVEALDDASAAWTDRLLAGTPLAAALEGAGPDFDFTAWLAAALRGHWLQAVMRCDG